MLLVLLLASSPALGADGDWDPDDVKGRFDVRWVGAATTASDEIHLGISFYRGFRPRLLPRRPTDSRSHVSLWLSGALNGYFIHRDDGRIVFIWGDFGSTCCEKAFATRRSRTSLSVTIDPCHYVYGEEIEKAEGLTYWRTHKVRATDRTGEVALSHPNCD